MEGCLEEGNHFSTPGELGVSSALIVDRRRSVSVQWASSSFFFECPLSSENSGFWKKTFEHLCVPPSPRCKVDFLSGKPSSAIFFLFLDLSLQVS